MIDGINNLNLGKIAGGGISPMRSASEETPSTSFSDMLKQSIDDVSKLQQDASKAVEDLATGHTQDVTGVMMAMEKSDLAFKTLLSIRSKLMDAYDEIKNMPL